MQVGADMQPMPTVQLRLPRHHMSEGPGWQVNPVGHLCWGLVRGHTLP